jgi:hypothetical protein
MRFLLVPVCAALVLCACSPASVQPPTEPGVCWHAVQTKDGKIKFNRLPQDRPGQPFPSIEYCAAALERMRIRFLGLGGNATELTGAYQGRYLFLDSKGVSVAESLSSSPFVLMVRTGDGRLAVPGAMPQDAAPAAPQSHTIEVPPPPPQR